ncbi:MAG: hypothetical protein GY794_19760, partial [bacterium]|nr:hypothetical protein [bacterium]
PAMETDGGGILIAGADSFNLGGLTDGAGHVQINQNLIVGNQAGAGDGAGIALRRVNGMDIEEIDNVPGQWWRVQVNNNTIVNNVAGYGGGAISMLEAVRVDIFNNTIANNESTATAGVAFLLGSRDPGTGQLLSSAPEVAGIVSRPHSADGILGLINAEDQHEARYGQNFSIARMKNNIIRENRSRVYELASNTLIDPNGATAPVYDDLSDGLIVTTGGGQWLTRNNLLTFDYLGDHNSNTTGDPMYVNAYVNRSPGINPQPGEFKTIGV